MKTPTTKLATRRIAASIAIVTALAATPRAWGINWIGGQTGVDNTEESPYDISNHDNWDGTYGKSIPANLAVSNKTYLKSEQNLWIAGDFNVNSGDFVFIGPLTFKCLKTTTANATVNIVKKGDWTVSTYQFYAAYATGVKLTFTNESGNLTVKDGASNRSTITLGSQPGTDVKFYHRAGTMSTANSGYGICLAAGNGDARTAYLEISGGLVKNGNGNLIICDGSHPGSATVYVTGNGEYRAESGFAIVGNGGSGTLTIDQNGKVTASANGVKFCNLAACVSGRDCFLNLNGGTLETKTVTYGDGSAAATFTFNGGSLKALRAGTLIEAKDYLTVTVDAGGGTIDSGNYAIAIAEDLGGTGGMTFKGGNTITLNGTVSYTGGTTVEAGTVVVVPDVATRTALGAITVTGLANSVCEVVKLSGEGAFGDADLPTDVGGTTFRVSADGKSILAANGIEGAFWIGGSGDLATPSNWSDGNVPTDNPMIKWASPITLTNSGAFSPSTLTIPDDSAVVTLAGALTLNCLTNASKLAVASTGSLTITGDLVGYAANNAKPILYSNYGTVTVGGKVHFRSSSPVNRAYSDVKQYAIADANSTPIIAGGLAYNADSWSDYLVAYLGSMDDGPGKWVVGANGLTFPRSRDIGNSGFFVTGSQAVTLYSSADWTLAESYRHKGNDLCLRNTATVTIDTTDYNDHTTPHTVTLKGYINAQGTAATPLTVTGRGTVVLDSKTANNHTNVVNGAIAVENGATLQINKDVVVGGTGSISLAAGATLAIAANDDKTISVRDIVPVTLPESGTATLRIAGLRLKSGDYVILDSVPSGYADHLTVDRSTTAIGGRRASLKDENGQLVLAIISPGTLIVVR